MMTLNDGRKKLYQWDVGRMATVNVECDAVHFSNLKYGNSLPVEVKDGEVAIPNQLLLSGAPLYCWAFATDNDGEYTKKEQTIDVIKRAKPSDYVYTETEIINIQNAVENALQEAKESGDFKGEKGDRGEKGDQGNPGEKGDTGVAGKDGVIFTPSVAADGTLSWTNNGGLTNPDPVNIVANAESIGEIVQTTGDSETAVMSQNAVTDGFREFNDVDMTKGGCLNFSNYGARYTDTTIPSRIIYGAQKYYQSGWHQESGNNTRCYVDFFQPRVGKFYLTPKSGYKLGLVETASDKQTVITNVLWGASQGISTGENYFTIRAARNDNGEIPVGEIPFELTYLDNLSISGSITVDNFDFEHGDISAETGKISNSTASGFVNFYRTGKLLRVIPNSSMTINRKNGTLRIREYDINGNFVKGENLTSISVWKVSNTTVYVKFTLETSENPDVSISIESTDPFPVWVYNFDMGGNGGEDEDVLSFLYEVNVNQGLSIDEDGSSVEQYSNTKYYTSGCLMLPPNYDNKGKPVPIIYFAHGSDDYNQLSDTVFSRHYMDYLKYLRDEGFAVFDCYGWTNKYGVWGGQTATPTQIASINQGIDWVCKNFNVDASKLYISAKSLGGISALAMCYLRNGIKPCACALLAPCLDIYDLAFGYSAAQRTRLAMDFGFTDDTNGVLTAQTNNIDVTNASEEFYMYANENAVKMIGYNPIWTGVVGLDVGEMIAKRNTGRNAFASYLQTVSKMCNVPLKIFDAADDGFYTVSKACVQAIKNAGCLAELRTFPSGTGGHHAVDYAENALKVDSIVTKCGVTHMNVPLAYVEMVNYFNRFA